MSDTTTLAPERKSAIEDVFEASFIELLELVPTNPFVRAWVLKFSGKLPPEDCVTFELLKDWVEFNCVKRIRPKAQSSPQADDGIGILVHFSETEYGRANYSVDRSGEDTFQIGQEELLTMVQAAIDGDGGLGEVVDQITSKINDDAWNECDPDMDSYGDYDYDEHDSNDSGNSEVTFSRDQNPEPCAGVPAKPSPGTSATTLKGQTMKLIKLKQEKLVEEKSVAGLVNAKIEYAVEEAKGKLEYTGPKLDPELWHQILSFFRWTFKEHSSECQVRLYVNVKLGKWQAWAFPQAARTGMTARELPVHETEEKARERFAVWESEPSDDWLYFGTVHHHCSASAFQSSTDEQNEWNQDGLHLTVGKMDQERHDLHTRFYLAGNGYEPDLGSFWQIEPDLAERIPEGLHHHLAAFQMGERVTVDFPDIWRENLVEAVPEYRALVPLGSWAEEEFRVPMLTRVDEALEDIHHQCSAMSVDEGEWMADLQNLVGNEVAQVILAACLKHQVSPESLLQVLSQSMLELD